MQRIFYLLILLIAAPCLATASDNAVLFGDANDNYTQVLVADDAPESVVCYADELASYFKKATGHSLQINRERDNSAAWPVKIYFGNTNRAKEFSDKIAGMNRDAFFILVNNPQEVVIAGNSERALYFAMFKLLELCNMHFIMPGSDGIITPHDKVMQMQPTQFVTAPAFESRLLSWGALPQRPVWQEFSFKHGMRENAHFHHNLHNVFPPSEFVKSHPEFYALIGGSRATPTSDEDSGSWQLCFSAPGSAEAAAERIKQFFAENPDENFYSLGANDSYDQCECSDCLQLNGNTPNSLGVANISESYYSWCNKIAEIVTAAYPDKKLGLLAYDGVIDPPQKVQAHTALVPFITFDRYMWLDSDRKNSALAHQQQWQQQVGEIGYYDYIYGNDYIIPRIYIHHLQQTLQAASESNVKHFYAEIYSAADWHDGPWTYIVLKLLWDPAADVDALLDQWCIAAVGEKAAPVLRKYYENCEQFWCNEVIKSSWFNRPSMYVFLDFTSRQYLDVLPEGFLAEQSRLLDEVCALSNNSKCAELIRQSFNLRRGPIEAYLEKTRTMNMSYRAGRTVCNDSFDSNMCNWLYWQRESSAADSGGKFKFSSDQGHTKPGSLLILPHGAKQRPMVFLNDFPAQAGEYYEVSVYCKVEDFPPNGEARLEVNFMQGNEWLDEIYSVFIPADVKNNSWQQLKCYVKVPVGIEADKGVSLRIHFAIENTDQGAVYWDDCLIRQVYPQE